MDQEIKAKWLQALRSGEYEQGEGFLKKTGSDGKTKHCCLGVLCELGVIAEVTTQHKDGCCERNAFLSTASGSPYTRFLPDTVATWADIRSETESALARMNDEGKSFAYIANYIEEHL